MATISIRNFFNKFRRQNSYWYFTNKDFDVCEKFDENFSILWGRGFYEIFNPIDICADKVCNLKYIKVDDNGKIIEFNNFEKVFMRKVNDITTFSQFIYNYAFNYMASGNAFVHFLKTGNYISYANVLNTDLVFPDYTNNNGGLIVSKDNNIKGYLYNDYFISKKDVFYSCYLPQTFNNETKFGTSPLKIVERNINLLSAVYMARWNVYNNNGMAGIITKKAANENAFDMALDPVTQQSIATELFKEYNISKLNNIKGISSVPLEFIKTLATISELEPFREVQADSIAIAAVYGVKKELLGRETDTTFNNQRDAERFLWQNTIKSVAFDASEMLESLFSLKPNEHIIPDFSNIEVLQDDESTRIKTLSEKIDVYAKIKEMTGVDYNDKIIEISKNI